MHTFENLGEGLSLFKVLLAIIGSITVALTSVTETAMVFGAGIFQSPAGTNRELGVEGTFNFTMAKFQSHGLLRNSESEWRRPA